MWPAVTFLVPPWNHGARSGEVGEITAPTDLGEWDDSYVVQMDVPGFTRDDIDVSVSGTTVHVETEPRDPHEPHDAEFHHRERDSRPVGRELELPMQIKEKAMTVTVDGGVLTLLLPKDFENVTN